MQGYGKLCPQVVENDETILMASTIVHLAGLVPYRVVLRCWRGEYVTHRQLMRPTLIHTWEGSGFDDGHYFKEPVKAYADFVSRAKDVVTSAMEDSADPERVHPETMARLPAREGT